MIYRLKEAGGYPTRTIFDTCGTSQEKSSCSTRNYSWIYFLRRNPFSANPQRQLKRIREISVVIFSKQWKPCWKPLYEEESKEKKRLKKPCICVLWLYQLSNFFILYKIYSCGFVKKPKIFNWLEFQSYLTHGNEFGTLEKGL